ncbi:hypothetical protein ACFY30_22130 [Streptomyces sp. NPDC000345]|uniref:hypothetical protein n=1 Tax=Streptomyces sp. NPDC000345 TaxID=3364537 RepID=UPI003683DA4A
MATRPRCASGHFLPTTAQPGEPCHCVLTRRPRHRRARVRDHHDLWGQGRHIAHRTMTTIRLAGSYL